VEQYINYIALTEVANWMFRHDMPKKSQKLGKGEAFEKNFCEFLNRFIPECFGIEGFKIAPIREQTGVWQGGKDIRNVKWSYEEQPEFNWRFECKAHEKNEIKKKEVVDKILDTLLEPDNPSCWCLVCRNSEVDRWIDLTIKRLNNARITSTHFFCWTPNELNLKKCIAFYPDIFAKIYPNENIVKYIIKDKENFLKDLREEFIESNKRAVEEPIGPRKLSASVGVDTKDLTSIKESIDKIKDNEKQIKILKKKLTKK